jgi:CHAT domain-containing protein
MGVSRSSGEFPALPAVPGELAAVVREKAREGGALPGRRLLDGKFDLKALSDSLTGKTPILHLATHFQFEPTVPDQSFLLLGDGSRLTVHQINNDSSLPFDGLDQLTLSACETAAGADRGDGREVEGFGALAAAKGAKSVLATLWPIADASTGELMKEFYAERYAKRKNKAEALRSAQLKLLRNNDGLTSKPVFTESRGKLMAAMFLNGEANAAPPWPGKGFSHPYYWAPFVLMGNWR